MKDGAHPLIVYDNARLCYLMMGDRVADGRRRSAVNRLEWFDFGRKECLT